MFEGIVSDLLIRYLGKYIKDLNKENLNIGIWGGDVVLDNLELKAEALNSLNLPFSVKKGFIGRLRLKVPWTNLKSQPVIVLIEKVFVIAQLDYNYSEYDEEKEKKREAQEKTEKLAQAELMKSFHRVNDATEEDTTKGDSFVQRLVTKIVDNLQVEINQVHIRFEDSTTDKSYPFAFGVCMQSLKLRSTDENWKEMFLENRTSKLIYKLAKLEHLSVYFNHMSDSFTTLKSTVFMNSFSNLISTDRQNKQGHHFLLNPISASLKLTINTSDIPDKKIPKVTSVLSFDDIAFEIEEIQYQTMLKLVDAIARYEKGKKYLKYRPVGSIRPKDKSSNGAKLWWNYAINSVLSDVRAKRDRLPWKYLLQRRRDRLSYVQLYKRTNKGTWLKPLSKDEMKTLQSLEDKFNVEDIIYFRALADAQLKREQSILETNVNTLSSNSNANATTSISNTNTTTSTSNSTPNTSSSTSSDNDNSANSNWSYFGSVWGSAQWLASWVYFNPSSQTNSSEYTDQVPEVPVFELSEEDRKKFFATIEYDASINQWSMPIDKEYVKTAFNFHMKTGSISLKNSQEQSTGIVSAKFKDFQLSILSRIDSFSLKAILNSVVILDKSTPHTLFPILIKPVEPSGGKQLNVTLVSDQNALDASTDTASFFSLLFEKKPVQTDFDYRINVQMLPLEIVFNKHCIDHITNFFLLTNESSRETIEKLEIAARTHLNELSSKTANKLVQELQNQLKLDININISAPKLLFPESLVEEDTPMLVLDLGNLAVKSDIRNRANANILSPRVNSPKNLLNQDDFYDKFSLNLSSIQILLTTSHKENKPYQLVEKFDINLSLHHCIKTDVTLTPMKLFGDLPNLEFYISPAKMDTILRILQSVFVQMEPTTAHISNINTSFISTSVLNTSSIFQPIHTSSAHSQKSKRYSIKLPDKTVVQQLIVDSKQLECVFLVPQIAILLFDDSDKKIVKLCISGIGCHLVKRTFDLKVFLCLQQFIIDDSQQVEGSEFKYLVWAGVQERSGNTSQMHLPSNDFNIDTLIDMDKDNENLISAWFTMTSKSSPEYTGIDQTLQIYFHTLHLMSNRKTVIWVIDFIVNTVDLIGELFLTSPDTEPVLLPTNDDKIASNASNRPNQPILSASTSNETTTIFTIIANLKTIDLTLNQEGAKICKISISDASLLLDLLPIRLSSSNIDNSSLQSPPFDIRAKGSLGSISVVDMTPEGSLHSQIFTNSGQHMVEFSFQTFWKHIADYPGFDSFIQVRMNSIQVTYMHRFITLLASYVQEFKSMRQIEKLSHAAKSAAELAILKAKKDFNDRSKKFKIGVEIAAPQLLIPQSSKADKLLIANLGRISIYNIFNQELDTEETSISISKMNVKSAIGSSTSIQRKYSASAGSSKSSGTNTSASSPSPSSTGSPSFHSIVEDINWVTKIIRPLSNHNKFDFDRKFESEMSKIRVTMSESQYSLIIGILSQNLREGVPVSISKPQTKASTRPTQMSLQSMESFSSLENSLLSSQREFSAPTSELKLRIQNQLVFTLPEISLELSIDTSASTSTSNGTSAGNSAGSITGSANHVFHCNIRQVDFMGFLFNNESFKAELSLKSLFLDYDTKPHSNTKFKQLIGTIDPERVNSQLKDYKILRILYRRAYSYSQPFFSSSSAPNTSNNSNNDIYSSSPTNTTNNNTLFDTELISIHIDKPKFIVFKHTIDILSNFIYRGVKAFENSKSGNKETSASNHINMNANSMNSSSDISTKPTHSRSSSRSTNQLRRISSIDPALTKSIEKRGSIIESASKRGSMEPLAHTPSRRGSLEPSFILSDVTDSTISDTIEKLKSMDIRILVSDCEICMPDDIGSESSTALVIQSTLLWKYASTKRLQFTNNQPINKSKYKEKEINLSAHKMQLYKAVLRRQYETATSIINPFDFSLNYKRKSRTPPNTLITFEPGHVVFSYKDFLLVKRIVESFTHSQSQSQSQPQTPEQPLHDSQISSTHQKKQEKKTTKSSKESHHKLSLKFGGIAFTVLDDSKTSQQYLPVANIKTQNILVDFQEKACMISGHVCGDYYNHKTAVWEPVIENYYAQIMVQKTFQNGFRFVAKSSEILNANISQSLIATALSTYHRWKEDTMNSRSKTNHPPMMLSLAAVSELSMETALSPSLSLSRPLFHPFVLQNQTGQKLRYWINANVNVNTHLSQSSSSSVAILASASDSFFELDSGQEVPLQVPSSVHHSTASATHIGLSSEKSTVRGVQENGASDSFSLSIQLLPWNPINQLPTSRIGAYLLPLTPKPKGINPKLMYQISYREGSKVLCLRSHLTIRNLTHTSLHVLLEVEEKRPLFFDPPIPPGESRSIPIEYSSNPLVRFRPSSHFSWSDRQSLQAPIALGTQIIRCPVNPTNSFFYLQRIKTSAGETDTQTQSQLQSQLHSANDGILLGSSAYNSTANSNIPSPPLSPSFSFSHSATESAHSQMLEYTVILLPTVIIENLLPCEFDFKIVDKSSLRSMKQGTLDSGKDIAVHEVEFSKYNVPVLKVSISGYEWSNGYAMEAPEVPVDVQSALQLSDPQKRYLNLHVFKSYTNDGVLKLSVYCRYWMINHMGTRLLYRSTVDQFSTGKIAAGQSSMEQMTSLQDRHVKLEQQRDLSQPFMFSYNSFDFIESKTSIKVENSSWSKGITLETPGLVSYLEIPDKKKTNKPTRLYQIGFHIGLGDGKFCRSKVVTFAPRYVFINNTSFELFYAQKHFVDQSKEHRKINGESNSGNADKEKEIENSVFMSTGNQNQEYAHVYSLLPNERGAWHWTSKDHPKEICMSLTFPSLKPRKNSVGLQDRNKEKNNDNSTQSSSGSDKSTCMWSSGFVIDQLGDFAVKVPITPDFNPNVNSDDDSQNLARKMPYYARVHVKFEKPTFYIIFNEESKEFPPYRIENFTLMNITYYQKGVGIPATLLPYESTSYTWDEPFKPHKLVVEIMLENQLYKKEINMDILRNLPPEEIMIEELNANSNYRICLQSEVFADGPTRVYRISDIQLHKENPNKPLQDRSEESQTIHKEVVLDLAGIGISLIDELPQELIYIRFDGINFEYSDSKVTKNLECMINKIQMDNQLHDTKFPVIFSTHQRSTPTTKMTWSITKQTQQDKNIFHLSVVKSNQYNTIDFFPYFSVLIGESDIYLHETLLTLLVDWFNQVLTLSSTSTASTLVHPQRRYSISAPTTVVTSQKKMYFETLHLHPIKIHLSYASNVANDKRTDTIVSAIMGAVGVTVANVDNAQISLNSLLLQYPFSTREELIERISNHYYMQAIRELYKVVGSFDILGNPVSLVSNLGIGVYDFFYEPAQALVTSPKDIVKGIAKGTTSLVKNSVYGISTTASKISASLGKGLTALSMDEAFVREREISEREKPKYVGEGIASGLKTFATLAYKGVTGLVYEPIIGASEAGLGGLFKGVRKAVIGAAVKPAVGLIDLTTRTTQAISYRTSSNEPIPKNRIRPPRYIGPDRILVPYSMEKSYGQSILYKLDTKSKHRNDFYLFHFVIGKHILVASDQQIFFANSKAIVKWKLSFKSFKKLEKTRDSIIINLQGTGIGSPTMSISSSSHSEITNRRIHSSNSQLLEKVFVHLEEAFQSFTQRLKHS